MCLIHNPGAARWSRSRLDRIVVEMEALGCTVEPRETTGPGDAVNLARLAVGGGVDVVAVFGGDGTMIQAVQGLMGSNIPIGLIPGGTGNLLAVNLGIPRDIESAARLVATGVPRQVDLGQVDSQEGTRYFAVAAGAGFDAELMAGTPGPSKRRWGQVAYVLQAVRTLRRIRSVRYHLTIDDAPVEVDAATVIIANCRTIMPPFLHLGDKTALDDGEFDVVVLHADSAFQVLVAAWHLLRNRTDGVRVRRFHGKRIRLETEATLPVQLDGEPSGVTPFTASMLPRALTVLVSDL